MGANPPLQIRAEVSITPKRSGIVHRLLRLLFSIWLVAYPVVSCVPILFGSAQGGQAGGVAAVGGLLTGAFLLVPWLVGLLVLGLLALLTR